MESKYRGMEEVLGDLGRKIDHMIESSELSKVEWKKEIDERIQELKTNVDLLEKKTKDLVGDRERWQEVEVKLRDAANELCDAVETAFGVKK